MNLMRRGGQRPPIWMVATGLAVGLAAAPSSFAQDGSTERVQAVAATQEYRDVVLELSLYKFEPGKQVGRKAAGKAGAARLLVKRSSKDTDLGEPESVRLNDFVAACMYASQAGSLTLWSQLEDQAPVQIYPNKFTAADKGAGMITADEEVCVGQNQGFRLQVDGKAGQVDRIYAHWTPDASAQLKPSDFPSIGRSARMGKAVSTYGSATVRFRVVP